MKEIKSINNIYLNEFDVEVTPYLSYAQIQSIVNAVCKFDTWSDRQQNIDVLLLHHATNITVEEIEKYGHEVFLQSGLLDEVKMNIKNLNQVYESIKYTQSTQRALAQILKELSNMMGPLQKVLNHGNKSSKK